MRITRESPVVKDISKSEKNLTISKLKYDLARKQQEAKQELELAELKLEELRIEKKGELARLYKASQKDMKKAMRETEKHLEMEFEGKNDIEIPNDVLNENYKVKAHTVKKKLMKLKGRKRKVSDGHSLNINRAEFRLLMNTFYEISDTNLDIDDLNVDELYSTLANRGSINATIKTSEKIINYVARSTPKKLNETDENLKIDFEHVADGKLTRTSLQLLDGTLDVLREAAKEHDMSFTEFIRRAAFYALVNPNSLYDNDVSEAEKIYVSGLHGSRWNRQPK